MPAQTKARSHTSLVLSLTAWVSLCIWLTACSSQRSQNEPQAQKTQRFELKGKVVSIDKPAKKLEVDHDAIPGFMGAMTMAYPVKDETFLNTLTPGDQITAQVVVSGDNVWLENIVVAKK